MNGVRVKICGLTRLEDALEAVRLGADALGFNFWPESPRHCSPQSAAGIIRALPPFVTTVGVFVNQGREEIEGAVERSGVGLVQLHGDEPPEFCGQLSLPVIKALRFSDPKSLQQASRYDVAAFLIDSPSRGFGGSGKPFDWSLLRGMALGRPTILAGGLSAGNVARAIEEVSPYAVDVASGVESAPGIKDPQKMADFFAAARLRP
jgi:phosphoribosylanthranilate isomerase